VPIDGRFERLSVLLDDIERGQRSRVRFYSLLQRHPEFLDDLDLDWLRARRNPGFCLDQGCQLFIGNKSALPTPLHNANDANLFIQVAGRKHWRMYDRRYAFAIDPPPIRGEYRSQRNGREFDPFEPDFAAFPVFRHIPSWEAILEPGDVMWIPPFVWHAVRNLDDPTMALGYRFLSPRHCFKLSPLYSTLDCLAMDPPIWKSVALADRDFGLVFAEQFPELKGHPLYPEYRQQIEGSYAEYRARMKQRP
jgi:hypothetical protein